jgi:hypothetical protein
MARIPLLLLCRTLTKACIALAKSDYDQSQGKE